MQRQSGAHDDPAVVSDGSGSGSDSDILALSDSDLAVARQRVAERARIKASQGSASQIKQSPGKRALSGASAQSTPSSTSARPAWLKKKSKVEPVVRAGDGVKRPRIDNNTSILPARVLPDFKKKSRPGEAGDGAPGGSDGQSAAAQSSGAAQPRAAAEPPHQTPPSRPATVDKPRTPVQRIKEPERPDPGKAKSPAQAKRSVQATPTASPAKSSPAQRPTKLPVQSKSPRRTEPRRASPPQARPERPPAPAQRPPVVARKPPTPPSQPKQPVPNPRKRPLEESPEPKANPRAARKSQGGRPPRLQRGPDYYTSSFEGSPSMPGVDVPAGPARVVASARAVSPETSEEEEEEEEELPLKPQPRKRLHYSQDDSESPPNCPQSTHELTSILDDSDSMAEFDSEDEDGDEGVNEDENQDGDENGDEDNDQDDGEEQDRAEAEAMMDEFDTPPGTPSDSLPSESPSEPPDAPPTEYLFMADTRYGGSPPDTDGNADRLGGPVADPPADASADTTAALDTLTLGPSLDIVPSQEPYPISRDEWQEALDAVTTGVDLLWQKKNGPHLPSDDIDEDVALMVLNARLEQCTPNEGQVTVCGGRYGDLQPLFDFKYTNEMIYTPGVPKPVLNIGCSCEGPCDPESATCICVKRQEAYAFNAVKGFAYNPDGLLKPVVDMSIWECGPNCGCPLECMNRVIQRGRPKNIELEIFETHKKGWGVRTRTALPRGQFLGIYCGELITTDEAERRGKVTEAMGRGNWIFDLDPHHLAGPPKELADIDPGANRLALEVQRRAEVAAGDSKALYSAYSVDASYAGLVRFFNHSCDPNVATTSAYVTDHHPERPMQVVFTYRDIRAGEELCISYKGLPDEAPIPGLPKGKKRAVPVTPRSAAGQDQQCFCGTARCDGYMFLRN